ncbi:hypothetical protein [Candidatus Stoquefichus massiliensis]|nr:hypothetical protein [Candidatus Stoquefichus massiliensis]
MIGDLHILGLKNNSLFEKATFYAMHDMSFDMFMNKKCVSTQGHMLTI